MSELTNDLKTILQPPLATVDPRDRAVTAVRNEAQHFLNTGHGAIHLRRAMYEALQYFNEAKQEGADK